MTPKEFNDAIKAFAAEIGPKAEIHTRNDACHWRHDKFAINATIYPRGFNTGYGAAGTFIGDIGADDYDTLLVNLRAKWAAFRAEYIQTVTRKMALAIISITAEHGSCTDAALRGAGFDTGDVAELGDAACAVADQMADKGPFSISILPRANAA